MSDMEDRMHTGEMYLPHDEQILARQFDCLERLYDFNQTRPHELDRRAELLHGMFAEIGDACYIEPPFHANFGGAHVHFGSDIYVNFNLTCVSAATSTTCRCASARTAGSARAWSCCRA